MKLKLKDLKKAKSKPLSLKPKTKPVHHLQETDKIIRGSGINLKTAKQSDKDQERLRQESYNYAETHKDEIGELLRLNLPTSLLNTDQVLGEAQQAAVDGLLNQQYGCVVGQAGVGKTTTVKAIVSSMLPTIPIINMNEARLMQQKTETEDLNISLCLVSFMGKSVQQIKRAMPEEYHPLCQTIHSCLGYAPEIIETLDENGNLTEKKLFRPTFTALNKLPYKVCLVDEAGTVPVHLWNELIAALPVDCRIILMGDLNQLPPVSGKSILGYAISAWPTFVLDKIYRNAGQIVINADKIIHGMKPVSDPKTFIVKTVPDSGFAAFQQSVGIIQALHKKGLFDPLRDAFIVPQNKDTLGQEAFNEKLVRYFNPTRKIENIAVNPPIVVSAGYQHFTYAVGDKVMVLSNDRELGLTNGMIGVVKELIPNAKFKGESVADDALKNVNLMQECLDLTNLEEEIKSQKAEIEELEEAERQASHIMVVKYQHVEDEVSYTTTGSYRKITHSYAMTCHKSQGSEYETVVVLCHSSNLNMLSREWLYTAVTRAQKRVVLLVNHRGLTQAVNRQLIKGKTLEEKAKNYIIKSGAVMKNGKAAAPNLPERRRV